MSLIYHTSVHPKCNRDSASWGYFSIFNQVVLFHLVIWSQIFKLFIKLCQERLFFQLIKVNIFPLISSRNVPKVSIWFLFFWEGIYILDQKSEPNLIAKSILLIVLGK